jgi:hypothetical protein
MAYSFRVRVGQEMKSLFTIQSIYKRETKVTKIEKGNEMEGSGRKEMGGEK